jgi:serine/threonine protein kinase
LNHPSIASTYELYINEKTEIANLVMEFCPYPSLESLIKKRKHLPEEDVRGIAIGLLEAVKYIHKKGISHRDIKPDNILVNETCWSSSKIKLVDFGVSKRYLQITPGKVGTDIHDMWTRTGNIYYCAPEIFRSRGYNASVDVWAVGVVLF